MRRMCIPEISVSDSEKERSIKRLIYSFFLFFSLTCTFFAQDFASIRGKVIDEQGNPLPGVTVTLSGAYIAAMTQITTIQGEFEFSSLPAAKDYVLQVELTGFRTVTREAIDLSTGQSIDLTISLTPIALQEEALVVAVEVPVRVLRKGEVVKDLAQTDFEITENGIAQTITGFEIVSRKIARPQGLDQQQTQSINPGRVFILIFNIFDYNESVEESIDYFFENIFQPHDQIVIITEGTLLKIERGKSIEKLIEDLKATLQEYKVISTASIFKAFKDLRYEADRLLAAMRARTGSTNVSFDHAISNFYDNYRRIWLEYKSRFITPDVALYRAIVKRVKQIEGEKWALCFQQRELFPQLTNQGTLDVRIREFVEAPSSNPQRNVMQRTIRNKQWELQRQFEASGDLPAEVMRDIFMEANITFHLILLSSQKLQKTQDFELREVSSEYEDNFRQISFATGGFMAFSNNTVETLQAASETEDYYYLLVYSPQDPSADEDREVEVKVNTSGVDVVYLKDVPKPAAPPISITDFQAGAKAISFSLINYQIARLEGKRTGIADVKITIFDQNSEPVFTEGKTLEMTKKETHISLRFDNLASGPYYIIIQVLDKIANESDVYSGNIRL